MARPARRAGACPVHLAAPWTCCAWRKCVGGVSSRVVVQTRRACWAVTRLCHFLDLSACITWPRGPLCACCMRRGALLACVGACLCFAWGDWLSHARHSVCMRAGWADLRVRQLPHIRPEHSVMGPYVHSLHRYAQYKEWWVRMSSDFSCSYFHAALSECKVGGRSGVVPLCGPTHTLMGPCVSHEQTAQMCIGGRVDGTGCAGCACFTAVHYSRRKRMAQAAPRVCIPGHLSHLPR